MSKDIIVLVTTLDCNRKCNFCQHNYYQKEYSIKKASNMTVTTLKKILKQHPNDATITLTGGEPFLNMPIIEYLCSINRPFCIQTNGDYEWPENLILPKYSQLRISINSLNFPKIFYQGLKMKDIIMRANVYLNEPEKTFAIFKKLSQYEIYDATPHIDFHIQYNDKETEKILQFSKLIASFPLPTKNARYSFLKSYDAYHRSLWHNGETYIYNMEGERIPSIYVANIPKENWGYILGSWNYQDYEVYFEGKTKFQEGSPDFFDSPVAYYHCLMHEKIQEERKRQIVTFNKMFSS